MNAEQSTQLVDANEANRVLTAQLASLIAERDAIHVEHAALFDACLLAFEKLQTTGEYPSIAKVLSVAIGKAHFGANARAAATPESDGAK